MGEVLHQLHRIRGTNRYGLLANGALELEVSRVTFTVEESELEDHHHYRRCRRRRRRRTQRARRVAHG